VITDDQTAHRCAGIHRPRRADASRRTVVRSKISPPTDIDVNTFTTRWNWLSASFWATRHGWRCGAAQLAARAGGTCSAIEHYTAITGRRVLNTPQHDAIGTDPVMLDMLRWHGAEEVEHKAVALDPDEAT